MMSLVDNTGSVPRRGHVKYRQATDFTPGPEVMIGAVAINDELREWASGGEVGGGGKEWGQGGGLGMGVGHMKRAVTGGGGAGFGIACA